MNFGIASEDDTSLMLTWNEPANIKGEIDYYFIVSTVAMYIFAMIFNVHIAS